MSDNFFIQKTTYQFYRDNLLEGFTGKGVKMRFSRNDIIEPSGFAADNIYMISSGYISQRLTDQAGSSRTLFILGPGNLFNEVTFLNMDTNCVTSIAQTNVELIKMDVSTFNKITENNPDLQKYMSLQIAFKLRIIMAQYYDLSFNQVERRLRNTLVRLCVQVGEITDEGIILPFVLTHDDLAQMISSTRSTVSRLMKKLSDNSEIEYRKRKILVTKSFREKDYFQLTDSGSPIAK